MARGVAIALEQLRHGEGFGWEEICLVILFVLIPVDVQSCVDPEAAWITPSHET
jgi:hypothetical protein